MLSQKIKTKAQELGYTKCGIIPATMFDEYLQELNKRSELFPNSKKYFDGLRDLAKPIEGAKSIIVCTHRINKYKIPKGPEPFYGKMYLFDNRVAYTEEHRANTEFETYLKLLGLDLLDAGVPDRLAGARAGVGKFGRNNFLYDEEHGSHIIINTWIVDRELDYDPAATDINLKACNDGCHKCIKACPTGALSDKLTMDMGKCICFAQFDEKEALDEKMREQMGVWLYGCDACQDVCPANKDKFKESQEYPLLSDFEELMGLESILSMDEYTYSNVLNPRFWYAGEENLWLWKCNAIRCMVNSGEGKYHTLIKQACNNEDERIREMAQWGCKKLGL